jgi:hypothetical protein
MNPKSIYINEAAFVDGASTITTLSELTDTTINSPSLGQLLIYSGGTWVNSNRIDNDIEVYGNNLTIDDQGKIITDLQGNYGTSTGYWFSDGDTGIHESNDDELDIVVGSNEIIRFDNDGIISNTSIGDTVFKLGSSTYKYSIIRNNSTGYLNFIGTQPDLTGYDFQNTGGTSLLNIGDNVGIGISNPFSKLHVVNPENITPNASGTGHIQITGLGYSAFITLDGTATYFGHNSAARGLGFVTDETNRLYISNSLTTSYNIIRYDSAFTFTNDNDLVSKKYVDDELSSFSPNTTLSGLTDVTITSVQQNDMLIYTGSTWVNTPNLWTVIDSGVTLINENYSLVLSTIELPDDSGLATLVDMGVTSGSSSGVENSYSFRIDGSDVMRIYSESDGSGSVSESSVVIDGDYHYMGNPSTDGSWRWFINGDGDLEFQKRVSGSWVYKNKFT